MRALLAEKTGVSRKMHKKIRFRAYLLAHQRKTHLRELHMGRPNLDELPSRCISRRSSPYTS